MGANLPVKSLTLTEFLAASVSPAERRRELLGEFEVRPNYGLAVRLWAGYYLTTDLFDGTAGPPPAGNRGPGLVFARRLKEFIAHSAAIAGLPHEEMDAARDEGERLAEQIQRRGLPEYLR